MKLFDMEKQITLLKDVKNPTTDFMAAIANREKAVAYINTLIGRWGRLERIHDFLKEIPASEKEKTNTVLHRLSATDVENAMGLDYFLTATFTRDRKIIAIRQGTDPDVYYKLPISISEIEFVSSILNNIHFLFLNSLTDPTRYALVRGDVFNWVRSETKGNRNRLYAVNRTGRGVRPAKNLPWQGIVKPGNSFFETRSLEERFKSLLEPKGGVDDES